MIVYTLEMTFVQNHNVNYNEQEGRHDVFGTKAMYLKDRLTLLNNLVIRMFPKDILMHQSKTRNKLFHLCYKHHAIQ